MSHPTVGVAVVRLRQKVPGRFGSSCEDLPVSEVISLVSTYCFTTTANKAYKLGRVVNAFEVIFPVTY